jgi:hypothetical protein
MQFPVTIELFPYIDEDSIAFSVYLGESCDESHVDKMPLEKLFDDMFEMLTIPSRMKVSKGGREDIEAAIAAFRKAADDAEKRLAEYEVYVGNYFGDEHERD